MNPSVAAIVLTYNEEKYIRECLESLSWCDEIWVVDSQSTDRTVDICQRYTSNVATHPFRDYADQRNWALDKLPVKSQWVLFVDSNERVPLQTQQAIRQTLMREQAKFAGYLIPRLQYFWGQPLRHSDAWPQYRLILFQKGLGHFYDEVIVHERVELKGKLSFIKEPIVTIMRDSLSEFVNTFNRQSDLEAERMYLTGAGMFSPKYRSYSRWNQLLKTVFQYLPFKPLFRFLYLYVIKQGFRDGYRGYLYAAMLSFYVFASYTKLWELKNGLVAPKGPVKGKAQSKVG